MASVLAGLRAAAIAAVFLATGSVTGSVTGGVARAEPAPATPAPVDCKFVNVDDMLMTASNQYNSGFFNAALLLTKRALDCRQDAPGYAAATLYACAAHEPADAKKYFAKLPEKDPRRAALVQRCTVEHIALR